MSNSKKNPPRFRSLSDLDYDSKGHLRLGGVLLNKIAKKYGTPVYVYNLDSIAAKVFRHLSVFHRSVDIHYAIKANANLEVLKTIRQSGAGADVVSGGELLQSLEAGFKPSDIIFSGVAKSEEEISLALTKKIKLINVESYEELKRIQKMVVRKGGRQAAQIGIRFNPDVSAETHPYITTGFRENKFGLGEEALPQLRDFLSKNKKQISLNSISLHIGSQLREYSALQEAIEKTIPVFKLFESDGHNMKYFDVGGGVGIDYHDGKPKPQSIEQYAMVVEKSLSTLPAHVRIICEPGRFLVGEAGVLLAQVEYIKKTKHKTFCILNTGMNHLIRPSLYEAYHRILPLMQRLEESKIYDVVGPICESSDFFARERSLQKLESGDFLAIAEAGAYGFSMASLYNLHALPSEVVISNKKVHSTKSSRLRKKIFR